MWYGVNQRIKRSFTKGKGIKMRLGLLGDLQLTNKSPERRTDDYWVTLCRKLSEALQIFDDKGCEYIIQPGDFFDSPTVACRVKAEIITILRQKLKHPVYSVFGQHDITGHSKTTLPNSPLAVLEAAGVVTILDFDPSIIITTLREDDIHLHGASFGESVPEPSEDFYNILVTHRMIGNRPLWPGQELTGPRAFLRKHPNYNLIVCGDYHYRFIETWNGRTIINPGAIIRKTIGKFDLEHKPAVVIFDTDTNESEVIELKIEPSEKIFDFTRRVKKKDNKVLAELVEKLKSSGKKLSGWKHFLVRVFDERNSKEKVREIINQSLEEIKNGK